LLQKATGATHASCHVSWMPPYHNTGLVGFILASAGVGVRGIFMSPIDFLKKPLCWLAAISKYRGTFASAPNFAYELCVRRTTPEQRSHLDLSSWEFAMIGAEPTRARTMREFCRAFEVSKFKPNSMCSCYGLAETTLVLAATKRGIGPAVKA